MKKRPIGKDISIYESDLREYFSDRLDTKCIHLIICRKGYAIFSFNQKQRAVWAGNILIISSGLITTVVQANKEFQADIVSVVNEVAQETILTVDPDLITALYYDPVVKANKQQYGYIRQWLQQFKWVLANVDANKRIQVIRNNLQSFFFVLEHLYPYEKYTEIKGLSSQNRILCAFCTLICEMCHKEHQVSFYADKLCVTPYYLSQITSKMANITPKRMIAEQLVTEVKHLLLNSELTISEISDRFHFDSVSYFCKFFKRYTGKSPAEYRNQYS